MRVLEHAVEDRYCRLVSQWGCVAVKIYMRDWPDRLVVLPNGLMFFCELKRPGEKPRVRQRRIHQMLAGMGHDVFVFDGRDWPAAAAHLQKWLSRNV